MSYLSLKVSVPICSFRKGYAREFFETEKVPPPSTVYGFLLSLIGEEKREAYIGTQLAIAILKEPEISTVLRTAWRIKDKKNPPGKDTNKRPDYKEILTGLQIAIFVKNGELSQVLSSAYKNPGTIKRYGGLCLGESTDLIDDIKFNPDLENQIGNWLKVDEKGKYPLPVWVDHVGSKDTRWEQFNLEPGPLKLPDDDIHKYWITIQPPA